MEFNFSTKYSIGDKVYIFLNPEHMNCKFDCGNYVEEMEIEEIYFDARVEVDGTNKVSVSYGVLNGLLLDTRKEESELFSTYEEAKSAKEEFFVKKRDELIIRSNKYEDLLNRKEDND